MQFKKLRISAFVASVLATSLAACGGGTESSPPVPDTPAQKVAKLEATGELPALNRDSSLAGPDVNGNGIRDDIEAYLQKRYTNSTTQPAVQQLAKALQLTVLVDPSDALQIRAAKNAVSNGISCVYAKLAITSPATPPGAVVQEIEAITANTPQRLKAYLAYNEALNGSTTSMPLGDACE